MTGTGTQEEGAPSGERPWWERRSFVALLVLLSAVPVLYPEIPPLVDLFGHIGRYRVQLDLSSSPWLKDYYALNWAPIGNLGVDLLVMPLGRLLGLELAVKLITIAIPMLTVGGFLWVAREVHHRLPPTTLFALPFAYGYPFLFGFVNFALSMALAFVAFGLWLRLGRLGKLQLRALLFVPIAVVVFFAHVFGWGTLGLLCFSAEAVRQHDRGVGWIKSGWKAALHAAVMTLPLLIMVLWRSGAHGGNTRDWFIWNMKWEWIYSALRDRWEWFDVGSVALIALLLLFAALNRRLTFSRNLAFSALVLSAAFVILPWRVFGSVYTDMRLVPYLIAVAVLAIRFKAETHLPLARWLAWTGLAFYLLRIAGTTISLGIAADDQKHKLGALQRIEMGARVASLVGTPCAKPWALPRNGHLGGMVIVRRHGFSNNQWVIEGMNLLELRYHEAGIFAADSSQIVYPNGCPYRWTIDRALTAMPRGKFDYVWMIDVPPFDPALIEGLQPVWRGRGTTLYRVGA